MSLTSRFHPNTLVKPKKIPAEVIAKVRAIENQRPKVGKKELLTLRLDPDVIASYRDTGTGWQVRMNDDLRKARKL